MKKSHIVYLCYGAFLCLVGGSAAYTIHTPPIVELTSKTWTPTAMSDGGHYSGGHYYGGGGYHK